MKRVAAWNRPLHPLRRRQFYSFGRDSFIDRPAWLYGADHIAVGDGVVILSGGWLAVERVAWDSDGPVLEIGDHVGMRIGCTVSAAESIVLEAHVGLGGNVTVIDSKHTWSSGHPNAVYSPIESAPIRIGRGTWIADRAAVVAGTDIGEQCAVGANSVVSGRVRDYSIVVGNPGRVVGSTRV